MEQAETELAALALTMYTDSSDENRFRACHELIPQLVAALKPRNSFQYPFDVKGVSVQYPADSTFRIFSWELHVNREEYRHYAAIQFNEPALRLVPLRDRGFELRQNPETAQLGKENWLGYAIYRLMDGGTYQGKPYYFLFGYDSYGSFRRNKVLDVLSFDEAGNPIFGLPVFQTYTEQGQLISDRTRIILQYGAEGTAALRYDPDLGAIIYENLVLVPGPNNEGPVGMPDGSYHALRLQPDGIWAEEEKLFTDKLDEAPRNKPVDAEAKDIIGRTKQQ